MQLIDTSDNNRRNGSPLLDWAGIAASGVTGAFPKCHENDYISLNFKENYKAALDAGLCFVSPYTFARPDLETGAQAGDILAATLGTVGGLQAGSTLALDCEEHRQAGAPQIDATAPLDAYAMDWYQHAAYPLGVRPYLYSRTDYILAHNLVTADIVAHYDLWLVIWDGADVTPITSKWPARIVQTGQGTVGGIDGKVDLDWYGGRAYDLLNGRVFGYLPSPIATAPKPDVDPNLDSASVLAHIRSLGESITADAALLSQRGSFAV